MTQMALIIAGSTSSQSGTSDDASSVTSNDNDGSTMESGKTSPKLNAGFRQSELEKQVREADQTNKKQTKAEVLLF